MELPRFHCGVRSGGFRHQKAGSKAAPNPSEPTATNAKRKAFAVKRGVALIKGGVAFLQQLT